MIAYRSKVWLIRRRKPISVISRAATATQATLMVYKYIELEYGEPPHAIETAMGGLIIRFTGGHNAR